MAVCAHDGKVVRMADMTKERKEKKAAYQKEYYEANKEALLNYKKVYYKLNKEKIYSRRKDYYEKNKEKLRVYFKKYRRDNKEWLAAKRCEYYRSNMERLADKQKIIFDIRQEQGLTLRAMGKKIGVSYQAISLWEKGKTPCNWDLLETVFPGIKERSEA